MTVRMPDRAWRVRAQGALRAALLLLLLAGLLGHPAGRASAVLTFPPSIDDPSGALTGEAAWADYDHDGQQELLITGLSAPNRSATTFIYEYNGTSMAANTLGLTALQSSSAAWGDYDNDGWPDLLLTGMNTSYQPFTGVFHNISDGHGGRKFQLVSTLTGIFKGKGRWGDYDNDGRPDILLTGYRSNPNPGQMPQFIPTTLIYHNECCGNFSLPALANNGLLGLSDSAADWGDFNMDGYLDFALTGMQQTWKAGDDSPTPVAPRTLVYMNNQTGSFSLINTTMPGLWRGSVSWYDYNRDGSIDLLITGNADIAELPSGSPRTRLYRYDHTVKLFQEVTNTNLPDLWTTTVAPGDYNNDGFPDLLINGRTANNTTPTAIYTYDKSSKSYHLEPLALPSGADLLLALGDFNGSTPPDKTLDVVISGIGADMNHTYFYFNNLPPLPANAAPSAPAVRAACWNGDTTTPRVEFYWDTATDDHDPLLTYNLRLGTGSLPAAPTDLINPLSDSSTGYHYLPQPGNMNVRTYYPSAQLKLGQQYVWSVQAVDSSYVGGPFSLSGQVDMGQTVANPDTLNGHENAPLTFTTADLTGNDNAAYQPVSYLWSASNPAHGTLQLNGETFTYTPNTNWNGSDSFSYYAVGKNAYCTAGLVTINIGSANYPPTSIALTPSSTYEHPAAGWFTIGTLSTTDPDPEQTVFTYALVAGPGDQNNAQFRIANGNQLQASGPLAADQSPLSVRVQVTDNGAPAMSYSQALQVTVQPNSAPTGLALQPAFVFGNKPAGSTVGALTANDPDLPGDSFTYSFVNDANGPDNNLFSISGSTLLTRQVIPLSPASRKIHLRVTDHGGLTFDQVLVLPVYEERLLYMPIVGK